MWSVFVECNRSTLVLSDTHGYITSPGYPNRYPPNTDCVWRLKAPVGNHIIITIQDDIRLERNNPCSNRDYLYIRYNNYVYDSYFENVHVISTLT